LVWWRIRLNDAVADIAQHIEAEPVYFRRRHRAFGELRGNRDKLGAEPRDLAHHLLVGTKLKVAIRTPAAAIERHHGRTAPAQSCEGDGPPP